MLRRMVVALAACAMVAACVFGAGLIIEPKTGVRAITAESKCPAAGCANGRCHGFDAVPEPDGVHEMSCPEATCSSAECHAWDSLVGRYRQASDASLNLWVLAPVVIVAGLILLVRKM